MSDGLVPRSIRYLFDCINQARQGVSDGQTTFRYVPLLEGYTVGCSRGVTSVTDPTIQMQARIHGIVQVIRCMQLCSLMIMFDLHES